MMKRIDIIGIVMIVLLAMMGLCSYAYTADKSPKTSTAEEPVSVKERLKQATQAPAGPTQLDLMISQRETLVERMQRLEAQYQVAQRSLMEINAKIQAEAAKTVEAKKSDKK